MRTALLVTDLEGVAGVDHIDALLAGSPAYIAACENLTAEVLAAVAGFRQAGFERIRVSDSHRAGSSTPNVIAARLPPEVELDWRDDAYAAELFDGVHAVACLGMHAAAGSAGFAAHTVSVHCGWSVGGRNLSESDIVLGLAAAHGVPAVFVSGDDVLEKELAGRVPYVATKTALSTAAAQSRPVDEVHARLRAAAAGPAVPSPALPDVPWELRFKSRWPAALLARSARPVGEFAVALDGGGTRERYLRGLALLALTHPPLMRAIRSFEPEGFRADALTSLQRGFDRARPASTADAARRALAAFLHLTDGSRAWQRADRALALHMLETHAPAFFAAADLAHVLDDAVARLADLPGDLAAGLDPQEAMACVDGAYVRAARGLPHGPLANLVPYARTIAKDHPLVAWILWQMGAQLGLCGELSFRRRPLRPHSRVHDLYWLTHLFLLGTRFMRSALDPAGWETEIEELFLAVPEVLTTQRLDLGAEIAFCLQIVGEGDSQEHRALLDALVRQQRDDGRIVDPTVAADSDHRDAHTTAAALLALAHPAGS